MASLQGNIDSFQGLWAQSICANNFIYMQVLFSQFMLETADGTSNIFVNHNNAFGMKPSRSRNKYYDTVYTSPNGEVFASYSDNQSSLADRLNLDEFNGIVPPQNEEDVSRYIGEVVDAGYATDPDYYDKWQNKLAHQFPIIGSFLSTRTNPSTLFNLKYSSLLTIPVLILAFIFLKKKLKF